MEDRKLKICVYAISKNEAHFIKRFADSCREADLVMVADTGSTDSTIEECKANGVTVHQICITPWRFDHARNAAIALIPKEMDVCISLDIDEMLEPGWREEIERVWINGVTTRLSYFFDWGCGIKFRYEKIHARHGYFWHHPCHEYPVFDKRINEVYAYTDRLIATHHPDPTKSRGQYMDLLELSVKEDPLCSRNAFYYARELSFNARWQESIDACKKYLEMPNSAWENERCYAMRVMARCYAEMGNAYECERWFQRAAAEAPNTREPWCELAMLYYRQSRWAECYASCMRALQIKERELVYTCDPAVWEHWPHDLASISAWHLGLRDEALEQAKISVEKSPRIDRLRDNLKFILESFKPKPKIPNIIHFMYFYGEKSRDFSYLNYLAVKTAFDVQKPDKIYFYYNKEPESNENWDNMKQYVEMVHIEPPTELEGVSLDGWAQYQSDVVRLQKLYEMGGIYLDTDCFLTKPLNDFMDNDCVLAGFVGDVTGTKFKDESMPAATILAAPKSEFIRIWIERLPEALKSGEWAWHIVGLPVEIYKENKDLLTLIETEKFLPFDFYDESILREECADAYLPTLNGSYAVHMWDTIWQDTLRHINKGYMLTVDNAFTRLFKKHVES